MSTPTPSTAATRCPHRRPHGRPRLRTRGFAAHRPPAWPPPCARSASTPSKSTFAAPVSPCPTGTALAFLAIHGTFGEDGKLQAELEARGMPYTGAGAEASRIAFDKILAKEKFVAHGVPTPRYEDSRAPARPGPTLPIAAVVKAAARRLQRGRACRARRRRHRPRAGRCRSASATMRSCEECIAGRELTVGILGDTALPVVEIRPRSGVLRHFQQIPVDEPPAAAPTTICPADFRAVPRSRAGRRAGRPPRRSVSRSIRAWTCCSTPHGPPVGARGQYHPRHDRKQPAAQGRRRRRHLLPGPLPHHRPPVPRKPDQPHP